MALSSRLKQFVFGKSLPTSAHAEERLSNPEGLAVLSSDALSSVAYATEEILLVLVATGSGALSLSLPIAGAIVLLLAIVVLLLSYRQTIKAYPNGGGAYIVARENLGIYPGLTAGASLMIEYILTVTVSISAGTTALTSAVPALRPFAIYLCLTLFSC